MWNPPSSKAADPELRDSMLQRKRILPPLLYPLKMAADPGAFRRGKYHSVVLDSDSSLLQLVLTLLLDFTLWTAPQIGIQHLIPGS
ncbi:hypothetical protein Y1Q_0006347 [Alligator mississippiensis]|uniref:Uncharacterized protein n=1 Tax=Alligator mississippiensis TaxID=8496 RepID=A0A151NYR8_ALLMI|nr:hypothetical protein Y1Q_0006347 [Alligator mississippiensis]